MRPFKTHDIIRSNPGQKAAYDDYRDDLIADFSGRCAYCNLHYESVTTSFEIDHFIPKKEFEGKRDDLLTEYSNLVWSCMKCNRAKGAKFKGNIKLPEPTNERFYDPAKTDYNTIFSRNAFGCIVSHDMKGKQMIEDLRLYRPIHILGWVCESLVEAIDSIESGVHQIKNENAKNRLLEAAQKMKNQHYELNRAFIASYMDKDFTLE